MSLVLLLSLLCASAHAVTLRVGLTLPPGGAEQWRSLGEAGRPLFLAVADGLLGFDAAGFVKPGLAESWVPSNDGRVWTFTLRKANWSDGTAVTSHDFAAAWKQAGVAAALATPDARHLVATFGSPVDDAAVFTAPAYQLWPVGTKGSGPFVLEAATADGLTVVKNKNFRDAKLVLLDKVVFVFSPTLEDSSALYRDGKLDWVPWGSGPGSRVDPAKKNAVVTPGWGAVFLRLNLASPRLGDPAFRRALSGAVDRESLVKELRGPLLLPAATLVPQKAFSPPKAPRPLGPNPEPRLTILYPQGETYRLIAEEVADSWTRMGIAVDTKSAAYAQVLKDRTAGLYEVAVTGWVGDYPDPAAFLRLFLSQSPDNDTAYRSAEYDRWVTLLGAAAGKSRTEALGKAQVLLASDVPVIPLFSYAAMNQIDLRRWSGWTANATDIHPWQGVGAKK